MYGGVRAEDWNIVVYCFGGIFFCFFFLSLFS